MNLGPESVEILLLIAAIVAIIARRLRLPYTVGLVAAGIAIAFSGTRLGIELTAPLIYDLLLPPLVFEAAIRTSWAELRRELPVVLTLATIGVLVSAGVIMAGMRFAAGWEWAAATVFGALISATDPVSVIALFREMGVRGRLRVLVESESLLNDGTAVVAFGVAVAAASGGYVHGLGVLVYAVVTIIGGIVSGAIVAGAMLLLAGRTEDHLVEITTTTVAAYGSFLAAEHFGASGVLAVLTAGIIVGNVPGPFSERGRTAVKNFWDYFAFVANSLIYLLIGMHEAGLNLLPVMAPAALAIVFVILARAVAVYGCCAFFAKSRSMVPYQTQHVLFWGGLRGALALALALSLPASLPNREAVITVAFAVVAFSVIIQGLTMRPFLRWLGVCGPSEED